jgi:transposase
VAPVYASNDLRPGRYKERNTVERCIGKLKQSRAVAARYGKRERIFQGASTSPRSGSGYETPFHDLRDTIRTFGPNK